MKTIFTTLAIAGSAILFAQQSAPSVAWTNDYRINSTFADVVGLDNNNAITFIATDQYYNPNTSTYVNNRHLVRLNSGGSITSDVILSVPTDSYYPWKLVATSDNGFLTTNENDGTLQKYSSTGALVWNKSFGSDFYTEDFIKSSDNNLIVIGGNFANESSAAFYLIRKMDNNGNTIWEKKAEKLNNMYYEPVVISQTSDGGYIISGVYADTFDPDYFLGYNLVKLDANGNVLWEKRHTVPSNVEFYPEKIIQTNDGGYVMTAEYDDDNVTSNIGDFYGKFDSNGNVIWSKNLENDMYTSGLEKGLDNGYILSLYQENFEVIVLRKIDDSGNLVWNKNYGTLGSGFGNFVKTNDGFAALTTFSQVGQNATTKVTKFGTGTAGTSEITKQNITIYPNPTADYLNLKIDNVKSIENIEIYDASGKLVKSILDSKTTNINVKDLKSGNYIIKVKTTDNNLVSKFIKN